MYLTDPVFRVIFSLNQKNYENDIMKKIYRYKAGKESDTVKFIHNIIIEMGFSPAFATSYVNAFCGMFLVMTVIILHRWYLAAKALRKIPEDELTEDNREITIRQLMDKYLCKRKIGLVCCMSYLIFFVANYLNISRLWNS